MINRRTVAAYGKFRRQVSRSPLHLWVRFLRIGHRIAPRVKKGLPPTTVIPGPRAGHHHPGVGGMAAN